MPKTPKVEISNCHIDAGSESGAKKALAKALTANAKALEANAYAIEALAVRMSDNNTAISINQGAEIPPLDWEAAAKAFGISNPEQSQ